MSEPCIPTPIPYLVLPDRHSCTGLGRRAGNQGRAGDRFVPAELINYRTRQYTNSPCGRESNFYERMKTLSPSEFQAFLGLPNVQLIDVRGAEEAAIATLAEARLIPLQQLSEQMSTLNTALPLAVFCHHGIRSEMACRLLEQNGFSNVVHLDGGVDA